MAVTKARAYTNAKPIPLPKSGHPEWVAVDIDFPAANYTANDLVLLCTLPAGVKCLDWALVFPDVDSNGAPTIASSLGVVNAGLTDLGAEVWGAALTAGQSTAIVRNTTSVCAQGDGASDRVVGLKVTTAAATYAGATKVGQLLLLLRG
jgi:hypothetical protein